MCFLAHVWDSNKAGNSLTFIQSNLTLNKQEITSEIT